MSSGQVARSNSLKRRHWSIRAHESLICRNKDGHFCLNVEGGAERGLLPHVGELRQDRINYRSGKLHPGEVILEVNHKRVPGMIKKDVIALIKRSADPVSLVTVKQSEHDYFCFVSDEYRVCVVCASLCMRANMCVPKNNMYMCSLTECVHANEGGRANGFHSP